MAAAHIKIKTIQCLQTINWDYDRIKFYVTVDGGARQQILFDKFWIDNGDPDTLNFEADFNASVVMEVYEFNWHWFTGNTERLLQSFTVLPVQPDNDDSNPLDQKFDDPDSDGEYDVKYTVTELEQSLSTTDGSDGITLMTPQDPPLVSSLPLPNFSGSKGPLGNLVKDKNLDNPELAERWILSIDGGGTRGILPLLSLLAIEQYYGKPINQIFDMFAGSSTGAIIAAGLASGKSVKDLIGLYDDEPTQQKLFTKMTDRQKIKMHQIVYEGQTLESQINGNTYFGLGRDTLMGILDSAAPVFIVPKYNDETKQAVFRRQFRTQLDEHDPDHNPGYRDSILADCGSDLFITGKDMFTGGMQYFTSFIDPSDGPVDPNDPRGDTRRRVGSFKQLKISSALMGTSAAPTYFSPFTRVVDGGVGAFNNPAYVAAIEALYYSNTEYSDSTTTPQRVVGAPLVNNGFYKEGHTVVWSFGTGNVVKIFGDNDLIPNTTEDLTKRTDSLVFWANYMIDDAFASAATQQDYLCREILENTNQAIQYRRFNAFFTPEMVQNLDSSLSADDARTFVTNITMDAINEGYKTFRKMAVHYAEHLYSEYFVPRAQLVNQMNAIADQTSSVYQALATQLKALDRGYELGRDQLTASEITAYIQDLMNRMNNA